MLLWRLQLIRGRKYQKNPEPRNEGNGEQSEVQQMSESVESLVNLKGNSSSAPPKMAIMKKYATTKLGGQKFHCSPSSCAKEDMALFNSDEDRVQGLSGNDIQSTDDDDLIFGEMGGGQEKSQESGEKYVTGLIRYSSGMMHKKQDKVSPIGMDSIKESYAEEKESLEEEKTEMREKKSQEEVEHEELGIPKGVRKQQTISETRQSDRLQEKLIKKGMEAALKTSKKRSLQGTNLDSQNSFAVLGNEEIMHLVGGMGVNISPAQYDSVDIMKDLEIARHALERVKKRDIIDPNVMLEQEEPALDDASNLLEWLEENSEAESFTVVQSKKKKKRKSITLLGKSAKDIGVRRSKRTTPLIYRGKGEQKDLALPKKGNGMVKNG
jgi:hypothetical protein